VANISDPIRRLSYDKIGGQTTPVPSQNSIRSNSLVSFGSVPLLDRHRRNCECFHERLPLFEIAAREWLASKGALSPLGRVYYEQCSRKLVSEFSSRLVSTITLNDIAALQQKRLAGELSTRTVNREVATLRQILKHYGCWGRRPCGAMQLEPGL
jgi:hypothetical protein